jgi:hypothetical protein
LTIGPKHRASSWCLLAAIIVAIAVLIGLGFYTMSNTAATREGSQGPLMQSAPGSDPAPLMMRPKKTP